jgi:predicted TIM-barrel fold metal-dependent hydrolase
MSAFAILDADGHVTESQEQVSKYLDDRHKRRPQTFSFYPWDGWDRRLLGTLGDAAGNADAWLRALDKGGMELTVLYPTLGLFMSFLKDREWAVALCKAYNTMLHEEFVQKSPRLKAVALLPVQEPAACAAELRRAVKELGLSGAMLAADGAHLLGDAAFDPVYAEAERLGVPLGFTPPARIWAAPAWISSRASSRRIPARMPSARCASSPP